MRPAPAIVAGMMPAFDLPGLAMPGQFGPMMRVALPFAPACAQNAVLSCTGMPSVITTARPMPASTASSTAPFANFGGTNTTVVSAFVSAIASPTLLNTGTLAPSKSTSWPPLPGVTPPTMFVPDASMRRVCLDPSEPVMPCTITRLCSVSQTAMSRSLRRELGDPAGRAVHRVDPLHERVGRRVEDVPTLLGVVAVQAHHQRLGDRLAALFEEVEGGDDAAGDLVAGGDAAEDVDEHAAHSRVGQDDLQPVRHDRGARAAADVEEVGRLHAAELLAGVGH